MLRLSRSSSRSRPLNSESFARSLAIICSEYVTVHRRKQPAGAARSTLTPQWRDGRGNGRKRVRSEAERCTSILCARTRSRSETYVSMDEPGSSTSVSSVISCVANANRRAVKARDGPTRSCAMMRSPTGCRTVPGLRSGHYLARSTSSYGSVRSRRSHAMCHRMYCNAMRVCGIAPRRLPV